MKRIVLTVLLAFATLTATMALPAFPALAVGYGYVSSNSGGAYIRAQPDPNSAFYVYASNGTQLTMYCWVDGSWADGNYWTNRWFQVSVPGWNDGTTGYINASLVAQQPTLPQC